LAIGISVYCRFFNSFTEQLGPVKLADSDFEIITQGDIAYLTVMFVALLSINICLGLYLVFFTHRLVGPLVRVKHAFDAIRKGDYSVRINLRKHDYLKDVADSFNQMADSLEKK